MGFRFSPCGPCCDTCTDVNTTISGRVVVPCAYVGQAGITVTATGPATVSTTTNALGDYTLVITKKGTYTITAYGPCGTLSQEVTKNTCSVATTGINFNFPQFTLTANFDFPCLQEGSGPNPYISFWRGSQPEPTSPPAFPISGYVDSQCVQPGEYFYKIWDDACFVGKIVSVTIGCADQTISISIEKKKYRIYGHVSGCLGWGVGDGVSVTLGGDLTGSTTTDGNGDYSFPNQNAGCDFNLTFSGPRYTTQITPSFGSLARSGCEDYHANNIYLEPAPNYYCFGICCTKPFTNLRVVDSQGEWPVDMNTMFTQCITKPNITGYPVATDFGGNIGVLCKPFNPPEEDGIGPQTVAYRYLVDCGSGSSPYPGQWRVTRYVPGCYLRPVPFPDGPGGGYYPVAAHCGTDGWPAADTGTTSLYTSSSTVEPPHDTCAPLSLACTFSEGTSFGIGDATLVAD